MKEKFVGKWTGIEYGLIGDYYRPNITISKSKRIGNIGKYRKLKLNYMKKYKILEYTEMLLKQMAEKENATEELKVRKSIGMGAKNEQYKKQSKRNYIKWDYISIKFKGKIKMKLI